MVPRLPRRDPAARRRRDPLTSEPSRPPPTAFAASPSKPTSAAYARTLSGRSARRTRAKSSAAIADAGSPGRGCGPPAAGRRGLFRGRGKKTACARPSSPWRSKPSAARPGSTPTTSRSSPAWPWPTAGSPSCRPARARRWRPCSPACLHALAGAAVHVLTFNDYLARRDAAWMGPAYRLLGLSVGCRPGGPGPGRQAGRLRLPTSPTPRPRRPASTTCATGWPTSPRELVHRPFDVAPSSTRPTPS
ncbi:MAG: hypothetical protein MZU84_01670 [Sphingobacterium sp.]|nr:hypothetical protein [Sphingobacterium sp.]